MDYKTNEMSGLITPIDLAPTKEFWRVMGIHSREIYCVYEIDPDVTLHPTGIAWDVNGVHKGLPFKKWAGVHGLSITGEVRAEKELRDTAGERKANKEAKRAEVKAEEDEIRDFLKTPVGERQVIHDTKVEAFSDEEVATIEVPEAPAPKKRGRKPKQ